MFHNNRLLAVVATACLFVATSHAFSTRPLQLQPQAFRPQPRSATNHHRRPSSSSPLCAKGEATLTRVAEEDEGVPIPFLDRNENGFIECYADSIITVDGLEYTIGVPCDYCVALCYFEGENLLPIELGDELMDDIFPIAENIVEEEFEEELTLQRTPQTLTLVGELEEGDDQDDRLEDDEDDDDDTDEEEVEVLLTFEHRGKEINLVRLLDPVLLVGKPDSERSDLRVLLTPEESEKIMPILEKTFLTFHDDVLP
mmetsp:Transcript_16886/g.46392  ORF Transcript_16886/g.46392 Transcript_16886/m.46392 type:complete len:256 (-) Transcript_16886:100-867(-)